MIEVKHQSSFKEYTAQVFNDYDHDANKRTQSGNRKENLRKQIQGTYFLTSFTEVGIASFFYRNTLQLNSRNTSS